MVPCCNPLAVQFEVPAHREWERSAATVARKRKVTVARFARIVLRQVGLEYGASTCRAGFEANVDAAVAVNYVKCRSHQRLADEICLKHEKSSYSKHITKEKYVQIECYHDIYNLPVRDGDAATTPSSRITGICERVAFPARRRLRAAPFIYEACWWRWRE